CARNPFWGFALGSLDVW
nr:immunoglobulin heavy chain junction region [Macaca mulatta]MOV42275.1 immunoglobulin heavy chain junction region [Macaca mulatta]MOV43021.1 immunoglobulin heavy chain junction region [Macaca mulatta]MOV43650.1 immunoglobulin heavy chain junction region [Macaca mulatta]MOV43960.1 immunoglobulin heavy chain junction region [Macaca mulatta]